MLLDFFRHIGAPSGVDVGMRQSGALPYTIIKGRVVFLLVTSRRTGRWIFPKGSISAGMTAWDSAAKEAMEEAGVIGSVGEAALGSYRNWDKGMPVDVDLYPLRVEQQMTQWDEMDQRLRHWALLTETRRLLADRSLSRLVDTLHGQLVTRPVTP